MINFIDIHQDECIFPKDHFAYDFIRKLLKKSPSVRIPLRVVIRHIDVARVIIIYSR